MQDYEFRLFRNDGRSAPLVTTARYLSDFVAIRAAQCTCNDRQTFEVWRGDVCIYRKRSRAPLAIVRDDEHPVA